MESRSVFRGVFWGIIALLVVFHVAGGWFYSSDLIDRGFVPDSEAVVTPSGTFELQEVTYESPLGPMEAWYLPASGGTWVIHVHGKGATPAEADHLFAPLQEAGYPQLSITYRNDAGEPLDPSGYYQYGVTEWEDIEGALDFAQENGAQNIVFSGFSTGSSHILSFVFKNNLDDVKGMFFDSPNIDLGNTVDFQGGMEELPVIPIGVPPTLTWMAKFFTSLRIDMNWKAIDYIEKSEGTLRTPVLIQHGTQDQSVPIEQSVTFAEAHPDLVRLIQVPDAGHVESYDVNPQQYVEEILNFLNQVS
ncbi:MAG: prolyl oligopeptidase family serine peptidase [Acidimicrobiia bacterium]